MSSKSFVVPAPAQVSLPVTGTDAQFPVRRIYCIGKNYVAHVREMGGDETRDFPIIFQKPVDSVIHAGGTVPYPPMTDDFHHEIELMVAMKSGGYNIPVEDALSHVYGYGVCIDMTRRQLVETPITANMPWELKKSFDHSAPCSAIHPVEMVGHPDKGAIQLSVDGELRQCSDLSLMIWRVPEIISTLSRYFSIEPGDIIMAGTPDGVGPVLPGNRLEGRIENLGALEILVGEPAGVAAPGVQPISLLTTG
ncbi:MAG: fumarylacetoacetate hydrolase family protein [Limimaricola soesokkakensis]|uniref:fumarylacetoacetate hydrolase family protein n=1 Tax=Limimaricola soesokkakensis TaxID=1343159 RepID=UPI004057EBFD